MVDEANKVVAIDGDLKGLAGALNTVEPIVQQPAPPVSPVTTSVVGPIAPSLDSDKFDSLGNPKNDDQLPGSGKGPTAPLDSFTAEEMAAKNKAAEKKLAEKMSSTDGVDSRGMKKGEFKVTPQGYDKHGMRLPDKVDYSQPINPPAVHGPRGKNVPKDSFQG